MRRYVLSWGWVGWGAFKECKLIWCGHVGFTGSNCHGEKKFLVPTVGPRVVMDGESPPHGLLEPPYPKVASIIQLFVYLFILRKIRELLTGDMICGGANTWASQLVDLTILLHFHWWRFDEIIVYITWKPLESFLFFWLYFVDCCFFVTTCSVNSPNKRTKKKWRTHLNSQMRTSKFCNKSVKVIGIICV